MMDGRVSAAWLWALAGVFLLDAATTWVAFTLGGREANPVMASWPLWGIVAAKATVLASLVAVAPRMGRWGRYVVIYGVVATGAVVAWNLVAIVGQVGG
jgi:hypothetical protein